MAAILMKQISKWWTIHSKNRNRVTMTSDEASSVYVWRMTYN